jgi:uncharacterized protein
VVRALLAAGANVNVKEGYWSATAFHEAASNGHLEVVRALLAAGAIPEGIMGENALIQASKEGRPEVVQALVAAVAYALSGSTSDRGASSKATAP